MIKSALSARWTRAIRNAIGSKSQSRHASTIVYTHTDEAPALATKALLPVFAKFAKWADVKLTLADISVAGRILSHFPDALTETQRVPDTLAQLGELAKTPDANIIKLPNVSASVPQLVEAIAELQSKGYAIPDYPASPKTDAEREAAARYAKVLGSAVNPVLREGNSDRRVAPPVKAYAQKRPHKMGAWSSDSRTAVKHMVDGDFYGSEQSVVVGAATGLRIELTDSSGSVLETLVKDVAVQAGEVVDSSRMSVDKLRAFYQETLNQAKRDDIMVSLHLKATMMKVSDPVLFGHMVEVFFANAVDKHGAALKAAGVNFRNGLGDLYDKVSDKAVLDDFAKCYEQRPRLAMVDSSRGITNLHVPSDVIIDASMPCVVRDSGKMWNKDDALEEVLCIIPDRNYAPMYQAVLDDCRANGQFDPSTMGSVANVGLMAQKAEEYGSHPYTVIAPRDGRIRVVDGASTVLMEHEVKEGDVWRMCKTRDGPITNWVELAVARARATGDKAIFWLDKNRPHDNNLIGKVDACLKKLDTQGLDLEIMAPKEACTASCQRARQGLDSISCTGNVLRDYLTDLFPILELGTSAKMLSIVPLLNGGGLYETGAGGSAPKHVQQMVKENHLRWDSLGEYLATAVSFDSLGKQTGNAKATILGETLNQAIGKLLDNDKSPSRKCGQLDNRGSSYYIARYWADSMAEKDPAAFGELAKKLVAGEEKIVAELTECQGAPTDLGGYWMPDDEKATKAMNPSKTLNDILAQ